MEPWENLVHASLGHYIGTAITADRRRCTLSNGITAGRGNVISLLADETKHGPHIWDEMEEGIEDGSITGGKEEGRNMVLGERGRDAVWVRCIHWPFVHLGPRLWKVSGGCHGVSSEAETHSLSAAEQTQHTVTSTWTIYTPNIYARPFFCFTPYPNISRTAHSCATAPL